VAERGGDAAQGGGRGGRRGLGRDDTAPLSMAGTGCVEERGSSDNSRTGMEPLAREVEHDGIGQLVRAAQGGRRAKARDAATWKMEGWGA